MCKYFLHLENSNHAPLLHWWTLSDVEWDIEIYRHVISQILIIIGSGWKSNNFYHQPFYRLSLLYRSDMSAMFDNSYCGPLQTIYLNKLYFLTLVIGTLVCKDWRSSLTTDWQSQGETHITYSITVKTSSNISFMSALGRKFCISEKSLWNWNCPRQSSVWFEIKITFEYHFFPVSLFASTRRKLVKIYALHYYWYCWINISPSSIMDWEILTEKANTSFQSKVSILSKKAWCNAAKFMKCRELM